MWTVLALVLTALVGGIIAYTGDVLGRRFGKRRASLFGMRPKHTAILITSVTGVLISTLTTGVLFLVVPPVRDVILNGEKAIRTNLRLRREQDALRNVVADERRQVAEARLGRMDAERNAKVALRRQHVAERSRRVALVDLKNVTRRLAAEQAALIRADRALAAAHANVRSEQTSARSLAGRNEHLRGEAEVLAAKNAALAEVNTGLVKANENLQRVNSDYQIQNDEIAKKNLELAGVNQRLTDVFGQLQVQHAQLSADVRGLEARNRDLAKSVGDAFGAHRSLWEMFEALRTKRVVIHGGDDLARVVIPANSPSDAVRSSLMGLMHDAHLVALAKGAAPGDRALAVQIVDKQFASESSSGRRVTFRVTEDDRINGMVSRLARASGPMCVLVLAVANSVEGEPAGVDLQPLSNVLVYRKGAVAAARRIDAGLPSDRIFDELVSLLKGMGQSALSRGLIPRIDPGTGEPQVGAYSAGDIVRLMERVRAAGRRVEVQAIVGTDTNAADRLQLEFKVRPAI